MNRTIGNGLLNGAGEFFQDVRGASVLNRMCSIKSQTIQVILMNPMQGIFDDETSDGFIVYTIEVQPFSPCTRMFLRYVIRAINAGVVAVRPQVVIDDIQ